MKQKAKQVMAQGNWVKARKISQRPGSKALAKSKQTPSILVGHHDKTAAPVRLEIKAFLCHIYLLASSGAGKSYLLNWLIRQIIGLRKFGFLLLDVHGDFAKDALRFCILKRQDPRVEIIDIAEKEFSVGLNPLALECDSPDEVEEKAAERASGVMQMFSAAFGDEALNEKPQLSRWLRNALKVLAWQGYTLAHLPLFLHNKEFRCRLVEACRDPLLSLEWEEFERAPKSERTQYSAPLFNRVNQLLNHPKLRRIFAQQQSTINLRRCMDEGKYVLADLSSLPVQERSFLARCIVDMVYHQALQRPEGQRRPFFLFCDEFDEYVSEDLGFSLAKLRKFGISVTLAHQSLQNLVDRPKIFAAVKSNCQTVMCGRCSREDAELMALHMFTGGFRDDIVLDEIEQIKYEPVETSREVTTETKSWSESVADGLGKSTGKTQGKVTSWQRGKSKGGGTNWSDASGGGSSSGFSHGDNTSASHGSSFPLHDGSLWGGGQSIVVGSNYSFGSSQAWQSTDNSFDSSSSGGSESEAEMESEGEAEVEMDTTGQSETQVKTRGKGGATSKAKVPFYEYKKYSEVTSRTFRNIEAIKEQATAYIFNQAARHFLVKYGRELPVPLLTPEVRLVNLHPQLEIISRQRILKACTKLAREVDAQLWGYYAKYGLGFDESVDCTSNGSPTLKPDGKII